MIVAFNDQYRIKSDSHSWMVQEYQGMRKNRQTKAPEPHWESVEWWPSFEKAVAGLSERCQREIEGDSVDAIVKELQALSVAVTRFREEWARDFRATQET